MMGRKLGNTHTHSLLTSLISLNVLALVAGAFEIIRTRHSNATNQMFCNTVQYTEIKANQRLQ